MCVAEFSFLRGRLRTKSVKRHARRCLRFSFLRGRLRTTPCQTYGGTELYPFSFLRGRLRTSSGIASVGCTDGFHSFEVGFGQAVHKWAKQQELNRFHSFEVGFGRGSRRATGTGSVQFSFLRGRLRTRLIRMVTTLLRRFHSFEVGFGLWKRKRTILERFKFSFLRGRLRTIKNPKISFTKVPVFIPSR